MKFIDAMKKFFGWFVRLFEDGNGVPSSKRVQSSVLITCGIILAFAGYGAAEIAVILGAGLGLQGVTAFQR